jgi:hypothetical protein
VSGEPGRRGGGDSGQGPGAGNGRSAAEEIREWEPYRPPWYPDRDPDRNPWSTDPDTYQSGGETFYATWMKSLEPGELDRLIKASREGEG